MSKFWQSQVNFKFVHCLSSSQLGPCWWIAASVYSTHFRKSIYTWISKFLPKCATWPPLSCWRKKKTIYPATLFERLDKTRSKEQMTHPTVNYPAAGSRFSSLFFYTPVKFSWKSSLDKIFVLLIGSSRRHSTDFPSHLITVYSWTFLLTFFLLAQNQRAQKNADSEEFSGIK